MSTVVVVVAVESLMSRLSSVLSPSVVAVIVVTMVLELSVLVLMVVSEAVEEPITMTLGTFWGGWNKVDSLNLMTKTPEVIESTAQNKHNFYCQKPILEASVYLYEKKHTNLHIDAQRRYFSADKQANQTRVAQQYKQIDCSFARVNNPARSSKYSRRSEGKS